MPHKGKQKGKINNAPYRSNVRNGQEKASSIHEKFDQIIKSDTFNYKLNELRLFREYESRSPDVKVSIIMPTWNRAFVIGRAIDSVLQQVYKNFELIISDDGGTDNTKQYIEQNYDDSRIRYIKNSHSGVSAARNSALAQSSGSLIGYLDSDDEWSKNYLLIMVNAFVDNPAVNTIYCGVRCFDYRARKKSIFFRPYDRKALLQRNYIPINGFMHRRFLFKEMGGFDPGLPALVDWDLILRYTEGHPPMAVPCILATYYVEKGVDHLIFRKDLEDIYETVKKRHSAA